MKYGRSGQTTGTREAQLMSTREYRAETERTAMLPIVPSHHHRSRVRLLAKRVFHLRVYTLERLDVGSYVFFGIAKELRKRGLRLGEIGLLHLHLLPYLHVRKRLPQIGLLHCQRSVMRMK